MTLRNDSDVRDQLTFLAIPKAGNRPSAYAEGGFENHALRLEPGRFEVAYTCCVLPEADSLVFGLLVRVRHPPGVRSNRVHIGSTCRHVVDPANAATRSIGALATAAMLAPIPQSAPPRRLNCRARQCKWAPPLLDRKLRRRLRRFGQIRNSPEQLLLTSVPGSPQPLLRSRV